MKIRILYIFFGVALLAFFQLSNSAGRAAGPGRGNTGAPGDETLTNGNPRTCVTCHASSATTQVSLSMVVKDANGDPISGYSPGDTYDVELTVNLDAGTASAYGFQMLSLIDASEASTDSWSDPGSNTQIATASNGRDYAEHAGPSNTNVFNVKWTAPLPGAGPITFYAAGNAVNENGTTSGDGANLTNMSLAEGFTLSTDDIAAGLESARIVPNPVKDQLNIELGLTQTDRYTFTLFQTDGREIWTAQESLQSGDALYNRSVTELDAGLYYIQIEQGAFQKTIAFIKQ